MKITVSMPCFGRAKGTIRAINCIAAQTVDQWEALVIGDGCPVLQDFLDSDYFGELVVDAGHRGNALHIINNPVHHGGHGYKITNDNIDMAQGKYFVFFANDDIILPNHFDNYLSAIEGTDNDFMYFDSWVNPRNAIRIAQLQYGSIGHSELIVRSAFLKQMPKHHQEYGHDWQLIHDMARLGKHAKAEGRPATYHVMSLSDNREQGLD